MKFKTVLGIIMIGIISANISASAVSYTDVPSGHWAAEVIDMAAETGIMHGRDDGSFGLGDTIKRSEFAAMLVRMMKWENSSTAGSMFSDVSSGEWYFNDVNTLYEHGVCDGELFRPNDNITRREMAVMLVKALEYSSIADGEKESPFTDVTDDIGYISVAYSLGIINGKSDTVFDPDGFALREEGAAMMMRMYDKLSAKLNEIHGFYAISSWAQRDIAAEMDSVSFGWSRLTYDNGVYLNQTTDNGNDWYVPSGYEDAINYVKKNNVEINLAVTMTDIDDCNSILLSPQNRSEAISYIVKASDEFDGVTIDFEGMKGDDLKTAFNEFISELKSKLDEKLLYVAVHPVLKNSSEYFDAYDYRTLGNTADKIILMAHDYSAYTLPENLLNTDFIATPVTPIDEVFTALKAITDPQMGVSDRGKILLALSTSSTAAWNTTDKKITDSTSIHPSIETVEKRLAQPDTEINYSETYKNPYAFYTTETGQQILLWYEDSRSIKDKIELAKLFDITGISVWRIGEIADGDDAQYMNIWETIVSERN